MIRPFTIAIPDAVLIDLNDRLQCTRWPADFANDDWRYGANTAFVRDLAAYWQDGYDWRAREALMNAFPQFRTQMGGIPIHFIHVRGKGPAPIPIILNHGWPWTFWDFHKLIGRLTDPATHGGDPDVSFNVIVPSLPGYGFSSPLETPGMNWWKTADLWIELMDQLGYDRFATQGGDWGAFISAQLGHKYPDRIIGVHIHTCAPLDFLSGKGWDPADYAEDERHLLGEMAAFSAEEVGYMALQTTKPQTPAIALNDSPAGLLAWLVEKRRRWSDCGGDVESRFSRDELLDTVMLYWVTSTYHTSARYYWEGAHDRWSPSHDRLPVVEAPVALPMFPRELTKPSRAWAKRYYNLQRWTDMPAGGHFAAMEEPAALASDIQAFFRTLR